MAVEWPRLQIKKDPGRSFYLAVNEVWLNTHKIPAWKREYGISDEISDKINKELLTILHSIPDINKLNLTPETPKEHLQLLCYIWKNKTVKSEESFLHICLNQLMGFNEVSDIANFLGWMLRSSIPTIFRYSVAREFDPPFLIRTTLTPGGLLLPMEYYLNPHLKKSGVWSAYEKFVATCAIELGLPFLHKAIEAEQALAKFFSKPSFHLAESKRGKSWKSWMPEFEWSAFMAGLDVDSEWERRIWTIQYPEKFKDMLHWICSAGEETVVALMALHLIRFATPLLRPAMKEAYTTLFHKELFGIHATPSKDFYMLNQIKTILPDALCNLYSKHYHDSMILKGITELVAGLKEGAIDYMRYSSFLSKKARSKVIEKLHRMKFIIGNSRPMPMPRVTYRPESFLHTICSIDAARVRDTINLTGKSVDMVHSEYPCFITNASYFPESNTIFLPWGILKYPFYLSDANAPLGWNHGGIGGTICHEITHAFDLEGSLFTPTGQYKETWTRKNRIKFRRETRKVSDFFGKFKHFGKKIDGNKTLSENWADLGGLKISLHSLNREISERGLSEMEKKEAHRQFFIAYALTWATLSTKKSLIYSMGESVHALGEDRVDRIVPQFEEWVQAFDIKEDAPLYLEPGKRLKFF
jgi:predicted metalloendopeptidase